MGFRVWLMSLLLVLAMVAESTTFHEASWALAHFGHDDTSSCIGGHRLSAEYVTDTLIDSETSRRQLAQKKYITNDALKADKIPCNRHGQSHYDCQNPKRVNPYTRGCSVITHCYRFTH